MKKRYSILIAFILMFTFILPTKVYADSYHYGSYYGKVINVSDGNTFTLQTVNNEQILIRIAGIDTTNSEDAYTFLRSCLDGKNINVDVLAISSATLKPYSYAVVTYNKVDLANHMLRVGLGSYNGDTVTSKYRNTYYLSEKSAKNNRLGIWKNI